jgi:hypothetical protein
MVTRYISTEFTIVDHFSTTLDKLRDSLGTIDEAVVELQNQLAFTDGQEGLQALNSSVTELGSNMRALVTTTQSAGTALANVFDAATASVGRLNAQLDSMAGKMRTLSSAGGGGGMGIIPYGGSYDSDDYGGPRRLGPPTIDGVASPPYATYTPGDGSGGGGWRTPSGVYGVGGGSGGGGADDDIIGSDGGKKKGGWTFGIAQLIETALGITAVKQAAQTEVSITNALTQGLNIPANTPEWNDAYKQLLDLVSTTAAGTAGMPGTVYSRAQTAQMLEVAAAMNLTTGDAGVQQLKEIGPTIFRMAELAKFNTHADLGESVEAGMEFAHLTGVYDPKKLTHMLDVLFAISAKTKSTPMTEERILSYGLPAGITAGVDPVQMSEILGASQILGLNRTTAGTGWGEVVYSLTKVGTAQHEAARKALFRLHDYAGIAQGHTLAGTPRGAQKYNDARALGLMDAHGNLTVETKEGGLDLLKFLNIIESDAAKVQAGTLTEGGKKVTAVMFDQMLEAIFEQRGARIVGQFVKPGAAGQVDSFMYDVQHQATVLQQQAILAQTSLQQMEQVEARGLDVLNTIATSMLPELKSVTGAIIWSLKELDAGLNQLPSGVVAAGGTALALGAIGGAYKGLRKTPLGKVIPEIGAEGVVGGILGTAAAMFRMVIPELLIGTALWNVPHPKALDATPNQILHYLFGGPGTTPGGGGGGPSAAQKTSMAPWLPGGAVDGAPAPVNLHVSIGAISLNGAQTDDPATWAEKLFKEFAKQLSDATLHNQGQGYSIGLSPYTAGGGYG